LAPPAGGANCDKEKEVSVRISLRTWASLLTWLCAVPAAAASRTYAVDASASEVRIHVGKSGAFGFVGHTHEVVAPVKGEVAADDANLARSSVSLTFDAGGMKVLAEGEPAGDPPKVEEAMKGPKLLEVARFPTVTFKSQRVSGGPATGGAYDLELTGEMTIHGATRALTLPVHVEVSGQTLTATGKAVLRHDQFGLQPISAGGGTVKVKNEIAVTYRIVARAR
jgi:polyisoprenoid-binding protein YceI